MKQLDLPGQCVDFFRGKSFGRRRMLALSYEFNPDDFETRFELLFRRGNLVTDVVVGTDGQRPPREKYRVWRANWRGTFHPKLLVLLGDQRVAVGVGSANLTWGGLGGNLECWQFFDDLKRDAEVLGGIRSFLLRLRARRIISGSLDLREFVSALPQGSTASVMSTLDGRLIDLVLERVSGTVKAIDIVSPLNCDPSRVLGHLKQRTGAAQIRLYTGIKTMPRIAGCNEYWNLKAPAGTDEDERIAVFAHMHAKMFAFHTARGIQLFWGSANVSESAWLRSDRKANVDVLVRSDVTHKQWDRFLWSLPCKHTWTATKPVASAAITIEKQEIAEGWCLLQGVWDGHDLTLEASGPARRRLWVRSAEHRVFGLSLEFSSGRAAVDRKTSERLGFRTEQMPATMEYRLSPKGNWRRLNVNCLTESLATAGSVDAVAELFWRYAGRLFPGRAGKSNGEIPLEEPALENQDAEEEELTRCQHQGSLDCFVLQWRLVVARILRSAGKNHPLALARIAEAREMVAGEIRAGRGGWTKPKREFVERLFRQAEGMA